MTEFTRVTIIGSTRRATLVLPSDEPLAVLLPEVTDLLREPPTADGHVLVSLLGTETPISDTLAARGVLDGAIFRLLPASDAPAPPEVSDVTDTVAERQDAAVHGWNSVHRAVATGVSLCVLSLLVVRSVPDALWLAPVLFAAFVILAVVLGWVKSARIGLVAVAPALGAVPQLVAVMQEGFPLLSPWSVVPLGMGLTWIALGAAGSRRAAVGGAVGTGLSVIVLVSSLCGASPSGAAAIVAVCVVLLLGSLPSVALAISGVTALDDLGLAGTPVSRASILTRVADAYGLFSWAVFAVAGFGAFALAVLLASGDVFAVLLGAALLLILMLRTRVMPHAVQAWALWIAALVGVVTATLLPHPWPDSVLVGFGLIAALLVLLLGTLRPRPHGRVRWRRFGDLLEAIAALSMLPMLLGVFGVYSLLLAVFS